jgi:hypothetical protein
VVKRWVIVEDKDGTFEVHHGARGRERLMRANMSRTGAERFIKRNLNDDETVVLREKDGYETKIKV